MKALNDLVQSGKIHYIGVSNVTGWQFQRIIDLSREKGYTQIVSNQVRAKSIVLNGLELMHILCVSRTQSSILSIYSNNNILCIQ